MPAVLSDNANKILAARYIDPTHDKDADGMFRRVSMGNKDYYELMSNLLFLPNSPTLFNLGLPTGGTLSACFVFYIEDTLLGDWPNGGLDSPFADSILGTNFKAACVAKAGGGVGYYLGNIRPKGRPIKSTHKKACGPVTVLRYMHFLRSLITQGGKRDLAQMGVLPVWHDDILEFIRAKDEDPKSLESFNISVLWPDEWLNGVSFDNGDDDWNEETMLWYEQCRSAWRTGCPGMLFYDAMNRAHATPHLGPLLATNPCAEVPNLSDEACNLGSLALPRFVSEKRSGNRSVDWEMLRHYVHVAIRFMDDILDANTFPHPDITKMTLATRKLGLGVMGWADLLALLHVPYDSEAAVDLADELMKTIATAALNESATLGDKKGLYPAWEGGTEATKHLFPACRNSTRTSIAPTGTIALIADVWGSIEPYFDLKCERTTYEGIKMFDGIPAWVAKQIGDHVPKTAAQVDPVWHVRHQAAFQRHTDLGVSKTINLPNSATAEDVSRIYRLMWESGCKGGTVFRDGCRDEQVLRSVTPKKKSVYMTDDDPPTSDDDVKAAVESMTNGLQRHLDVRQNGHHKLPRTRQAKVHKFTVAGTECFLTVGLYGDGRPGEIFLNVSRQGSTVDGLFSTWAIQVSVSLQHGMPLDKLVAHHKSRRFEPAGLTDDPEIPVCTSVPDYVVRWLEKEFSGVPGRAVVVENPQSAVALQPNGSGQLCPDCGAECVYQAGCLVCLSPGCGFSRCG